MKRDPQSDATPRGRAASHRARFIAFEGVEGCGKTTQIARLAERLRGLGRVVRTTREPGGTRLGEAIRRVLLDPDAEPIDGLIELFLLSAARRMHVREVIRPALARAEIVLCDRYADSSVAYQGGGRELGEALVERINELATDGLVPDLTILLDLPPVDGMRRVSGRGGTEDRLEQESLGFHERVRRAYLETARRRGHAYCVLDGRQPVDVVAARVWEAVAPVL